MLRTCKIGAFYQILWIKITSSRYSFRKYFYGWCSLTGHPINVRLRISCRLKRQFPSPPPGPAALAIWISSCGSIGLNSGRACGSFTRLWDQDITMTAVGGGRAPVEKMDFEEVDTRKKLTQVLNGPSVMFSTLHLYLRQMQTLPRYGIQSRAHDSYRASMTKRWYR